MHASVSTHREHTHTHTLPGYSTISSVQFSRSVMSTRSTPGLPVHHQLPEFIQTHVHQVADAIQPLSFVVPFSSCPQYLPESESFPMSQLLMRWPKYWSFSFSISPSKEIPGLISYRMDWLDLLKVQGTLKSLLQHHSSKTSILRHAAFFTVQLTSIHDHWKNHNLD